MRRHPALVRTLLIVLGLVPVGAWFAIASMLEPSGLGRNIGKAILVVLSPLPLGGLLMMLGGALFGAKPRGGRIVATVGVAIVGLGTLFIAFVWMRRFTSCGGPSGICTPELLEAIGLFAYALVHAWLIVPMWRRHDFERAERFP